MRVVCRTWYPFLLVAALLSCSESERPTLDMPFTGIWAGSAWEGDASALLVDRETGPDTLYIFGSRPRGQPQNPFETVLLRFALNGPGTYPLQTGQASLTQLIGGDVVNFVYQTTSSATGSVTLNTYNGAGGLVDGTFAFEAQTTSPSADYGPQARFEEGEFRAVVRRLPQ